MQNYLQHHGIKGQKWGVRRTPEQLGHETGSGRNSYGRKSSIEKKDREDREARAIAGANDRRDMASSAKTIARLKADKNLNSEKKNWMLREERELYRTLQETSKKYLTGLTNDEIRRGKSAVEQLFANDTSNHQMDSHSTLLKIGKRADLALAHPAGSKNRSKAERYMRKSEKYEDRGNWSKAVKYRRKYEELDE